MAAFLKGLILVPIAIVVVLLAVANRAPVTLSLDPFSKDVPAIAATVPLFAALFGAAAVGILLGGIGSWLAQGKHRRARRAQGREIARLRAEAERLRQHAPGEGRVALPAPRAARA